MDKDTDNILNQIPHPKMYSKFDVVGLVVGSVQMGKTTNMYGVINKALDIRCLSRELSYKFIKSIPITLF
ncbi:hypothetical protein [Clostridium cibarium]|uniref:Uncharacterized protein n=1 Tax=Clostridium cibarium TaxID=2762247 RepID=A0ABR8PY27_9CLOT|nr:hypothetical protein [Clostridium cibarium]MBD7913075.1 hypothetical protein [Clostridium cibarium]